MWLMIPIWTSTVNLELGQIQRCCWEAPPSKTLCVVLLAQINASQPHPLFQTTTPFQTNDETISLLRKSKLKSRLHMMLESHVKWLIHNYLNNFYSIFKKGPHFKSKSFWELLKVCYENVKYKKLLSRFIYDSSIMCNRPFIASELLWITPWDLFFLKPCEKLNLTDGIYCRGFRVATLRVGNS